MPSSGGNVAIRFSVENAETVRQALQALGKDGEKALAQLNAASQKPGAGLSALSAVIGNLRTQATGFAFSLGPLGTGLIALGPAGLAVAATLGALVALFSAASEKTNEFVERVRQLKEAAETAGLTISQFEALERVGSQTGLSLEQSSKFIDKLTLSVDALRKGGGPLFDALSRIDTGLVRQVASARNSAEAIDILALAYSRLNDQGQRNALATAIGGRGSTGAGQILQSVAQQGGLSSVEQQQRAQGALADEAQIQRLTRMKNEIDEIKRRTDNLWGSAFSDIELQRQKAMAEGWELIARALKAIKESEVGQFLARVSDGLNKYFGVGNGAAAAATPDPAVGRFARPGLAAALAPPPPPAGGSGNVPLEVQLAQMRQWTSVLGSAITPAEQLRLKTLELAAAQEKGGVSDLVRARALASFSLEQGRAAVSTRTQLSLASEQEILTQRLMELEDLRAKGFIKNAEEMATAQKVAAKEAKDAYEQQLVRGSDTPQLTRLTLDAGNLEKQLDTGLAGALQNSTQSMLDMFKGTKTLSQGLGDLTASFADAIAKALLMKTVVGPLSNALSSGLSGLFGGSTGWDATVTASAMGNAFSNGHVTPFAGGGVLSRPTMFPMANGWALGGEAGEEGLLPLRRMGNGKLGVYAGGGGTTQIIVQHQVINNHPSAQVSTRDEDDGRGGRRTVTVIDEMVASAAGRPGSQTGRALQSSGVLTKR